MELSGIRCQRTFFTFTLATVLTSSIAAAQDTTGPATSTEVITSTERYYGLKNRESPESHMIHIEGIVLYSDPAWNLFWLKDSTGRLFLSIPSDLKVPAAGTKAVVKGTVTVADNRMKIDDLAIEAMGMTELPPARPLMPEEIDKETRLDDRVSLAGTVVNVTDHKDKHTTIVVAFLKKYFVRVSINNCNAKELPEILGAHVEVSGSASPIPNSENISNHIFSHQVFVPDQSYLTVFKSGINDPFKAPRVPIASLIQEYKQQRNPRVIRVRGTIANIISENKLTITDGETVVPIDLKFSTKLETGSEIDVVGCILKDKQGQLTMQHAYARSASESDKLVETQTEELPLLTSARSLHMLSREQAARKYPVEIKGIVLYHDPVWRVMFVHDGRRGFYVDKAKRNGTITTGHKVVISGFSDPGGFSPMVVLTDIGKRDKDELFELPEPRYVSMGRILTGAEDCQWLSLEGVIQSVERSQKNLVLSLVNSEATFDAVICGAAQTRSEKNWLGSHVALTGVCGTKSNADFQATGIYFHVPDIDHVEFLSEGPENPFSIPTTPISDLLTFSNDNNSVHGVKISGTVTYAGPSGVIALQDDSRGILCHIKTEETPQIGDIVEIVGVPVAQSNVPSIDISKWRTIGTTSVPTAQKLMRRASSHSITADNLSRLKQKF